MEFVVYPLNFEKTLFFFLFLKEREENGMVLLSFITVSFSEKDEAKQRKNKGKRPFETE